MPVNAITPDYTGTARDAVENFNGKQVVYVCWERHLLFACPFAFLLTADTTFRELRDQHMAAAFGMHPQWAEIDWERAVWTKGGKPFVPELDKTFAEQGIGHKTNLRFCTPGLDGILGAAI